MSHHKLGFAGMHELGHHSGGLDLVDNPVPVPNRFDRDWRSFGAALKESSNHSRGMINPGFPMSSAIL
jgi:hypothetical protein